MNKINTLSKYNPLHPGATLSTLKIAFASIILFAVILTGCKKDDFEGEVSGDCPVIVATDPLDKAVDVAINKVIAITFNTDMDATTITSSSFQIKQGTTVVPGTIEAATERTFYFTPTVDLLPFTTYTGTVTTSARDNFKTAMEENYTWTFTTIPRVTLSFAPLLSGTVTGAGYFAQGAAHTVNAVANTGFAFVNWTLNGVEASKSASYQFTMAGNKALVANFVAIVPGNFSVNLTSSPLAGGINVGAGSFAAGTLVTVTATANPNYSFVNWTENGTIVSTLSSYAFNIANNRVLVANYIAVPGGGAAIGPGAINLGTALDFVTLTKAGITTTGVTKITGNIGVSPAAATAITGFALVKKGTFATSTLVTGNIYTADYDAPTPAKMTTAIADMETAYTTANGLTTPAPIVGIHAGDISGKILAPGLYKWATAVLVSGAGVTLNGGPNDTWVFQIAQNLTISNNAKITLTGGAQAKNIFWVVAGQATLGTGSDVSGIILSKTLISLGTGAKFKGRLFAQTSVTLDAATITQP
jgi:hypothetical protein